MYKIKKPSTFENVEQCFRSHTLNEILPYLPNEDCFFDTRHWTCDTTEGILPFAVTTKINSNSQQYLKIMKKRVEPDDMIDRLKKMIDKDLIPLKDGLYIDCYNGRVIEDNAGTITARVNDSNKFVMIRDKTYRIRKLTPRECFRLMGVSESDIDKIQQVGISNTRQYQLAGNSIVVDTLVHIFRKMFVDTGQETQQLSLF